MSKTIEPNARKTIKVGTAKYFLTHLDNLPIQLLTNQFGRNAANQIYISATYSSADNNRTRMEHLSLLVTTIGSKELEKGSMWLGNKIISEANPVIASIDIQVCLY